jgi:hypothetical protein
VPCPLGLISYNRPLGWGALSLGDGSLEAITINYRTSFGNCHNIYIYQKVKTVQLKGGTQAIDSEDSC